jgi:hypothetical protein
MIDLGQVYEATLTLTGQSGPPSTAVLTITLPDQSTVTPAVGTGAASGSDWVLTVDYPTVQAGLHKASWVTTGPGTAATDYFSVRQFISVISLSEAKDHLNKTLGARPADAELRRFMQAATEVIESKAGTCVIRQVTNEFIPGTCTRQLRLPSAPVPSAASVTSIVSLRTGGPTWVTADLIVNARAGTVQAQDCRGFWGGPWQWSGTAGRTVIPERLEHAAKEQLRHLWDTQRGAQPPALVAGEETYTTQAGWTFSIPRRVLEMLEPDMIPVVAA